MKNIITIFLLFSLFDCFCQEIKYDFEQSLFDKAQTTEYVDFSIASEDSAQVQYERRIQQKLNRNAIEIYDKLIDSFPNTRLLYKVIFNKANLYFELKDYESAKINFLKILNEKNDLNVGGENQTANYKKKSTYKIAEIEIRNSNFTKAVNYLNQGKSYLVYGMCGNAYSEELKYYNEKMELCRLSLRSDIKRTAGNPR